jgi:hypothetical protein
MSSATSHRSRQKHPSEKRIYWGSEIAVVLIPWLNATSGTDRHRRVVELLDRIKQYLRIANGEVPERLSVAQSRSGGAIWWEGRLIRGSARLDYPAPTNAKLKRAAQAINQVLARYLLRPELAYGYGPRLLFDWSPANKNWRTKADRVGGSSPDETWFVFTESHAVTRIVELCHEGLIDRLRRCACGNWFYAKFAHQRFCSTRCQQASYRDDPDWKKRRRTYMSRLRELHKTKNFRSLK